MTPRSTRPVARRRLVPWVPALAALAALAAGGCATSILPRKTDSREEAIRACTEEVPPDAVPFADAFAECMERRGWTYQGSTGPRG